MGNTVTGQLKPSKEIIAWARKAARFLGQLPPPIDSIRWEGRARKASRAHS
jgi:hypothetical protein